MNITEYYSFMFSCINTYGAVNIVIDAEDKIKAIEKFSQIYDHLFNSQWTIFQIDRKICHDGSEEKYL